MRRISGFLAVAAILIAIVVAYTYKLRLDADAKRKAIPTPEIAAALEAVANKGWHWWKHDPDTNKLISDVKARSAQIVKDPYTFELRGMTLRLYAKDGASYTFIKTDKALFDEGSGVMRSQDPVLIIMHVPSDQDAENSRLVANRVHVETSGITYQTKTGVATTDQPATFKFSAGGGRGVGLEYNPNTHMLHLKSQVALDWIGNGPPENKLHVEAGDLVYKEQEQKIYLSPWSKLQRQSTTINAKNSVVTLVDGVLHQVESDHALGTDDRNGRRVVYSADKMTGLFDENGTLVNIIGDKDAKIVSNDAAARTTVTGNRADLRFTANQERQPNGTLRNDSVLHLVLADGHAQAESVPVAQPGVQLPETRILRSEHIELEMKLDGKDLQEIRTPTQGELEFKPNRPDQSHRILDASRLRILYGEGSYVDTFLAWNVATHTERPVAASKTASAKNGKGTAAPALTWSDQMVAKFKANSNEIGTIEQTGNFRYREGVRQAHAQKAYLEQDINRITLTGDAHVSDDTGSTLAHVIVMNQENGDMDATGKVVSTHDPDKSQKPGTSMLDVTETMQAKADKMRTRQDNARIFYEGHAVMWQGANRISANEIDIDRDNQTLHAVGDVVSELVDKKSTSDNPQKSATAQDATSIQTSVPIFTIVRAPELFYRDDTRLAHYTGGVKLVRDKTTVDSKELRAFLSPKNSNDNGTSSLDHAFADGNVDVVQAMGNDRTRTGTSEHCEYYPKDNKVVLNGGNPQVVDSYKGIIKGRQLTYFSDEDRVIAEGQQKQLAYTQMKKK